MNIRKNYSLINYNSFGVNVKAKEFIEINSNAELLTLKEIIKNKKVLFLGGGSNILFTKDYNGTVIHLNTKGISVEKQDKDTSVVKANSGENWNDLIEFCLENNLGGIENLSLIPGNVGSAPVQNIGAYGVELKDVFLSCEVFDSKNFMIKEFNLSECKFSYRDSIFKRKKNLIILSVKLKLKNTNHVINTSYGRVSEELKKLNIQNPTIKDVSNVICIIRREKLPDPKKIGNAGSFFKNPIVKKAKLDWLEKHHKKVPSYKIEDEKYKIPAAWLIETAGLKGKDFGNFGIHKSQPLVLVNYGGATGEDIYKLSNSIKDIIYKIFKIKLETEVNII
tara:strand:+ start:654 stop:1661 length:1008 start_codon:yes stop_codon:yes gene_type:complete